MMRTVADARAEGRCDTLCGLAALIGCIAGAVAVLPASAQRRLALSVGIDKYYNLPAVRFRRW
jgi:hypothetical protein